MQTRRIRIEPEQLKQLQQADVWSKRFVPITLEINGQVFNAGLRHRGGHTRMYPKKSYEIRLEDGHTLHWNAEYDDPSMLRNALSFQLFSMLGIAAPRTNHCWVEWNARPLGLYLEIEAVDPAFFEARGLQTRSILYAVNDNANFGLLSPETRKRKASLFSGYELIHGGIAARKRCTRFIAKLNQLKGSSLAEYLERSIDRSAYLRWLAGAVLTGNYDGFEQNYTLIEAGPEWKYQLLPWDYEGTWGRNCYGAPCSSGLVRLTGYNELTRKLLISSKARSDYRKLMEELLQSVFTEDNLLPIIAHSFHQIDDAIRYDATRKWSYAVFTREQDFILRYIRERRAILQQALQAWKTKGPRLRTALQKISMLK